MVIRSAVPKGSAILVEAEPEGWYENALNAYVLEDAAAAAWARLSDEF